MIAILFVILLSILVVVQDSALTMLLFFIFAIRPTYLKVIFTIICVKIIENTIYFFLLPLLSIEVTIGIGNKYIEQLLGTNEIKYVPEIMLSGLDLAELFVVVVFTMFCLTKLLPKRISQYREEFNEGSKDIPV